MIIEFPTGLYITEFPQSAEDSTSITYLVSSTDPPRSEQIFVQVPVAEQLRSLPDKVFSKAENRAVLGEFLFSISGATNSEAGSNKKKFEVGEILDFETETLPELINTEVPFNLDLLQDTNLLDLESLGLTDAEIIALTASAEKAFAELIVSLNSTLEQVANNRIAIEENQKSINEARKAKEAALVVAGTGSSIVEKLAQTEEDLIEERDLLVDETNALSLLAQSQFNDLLKTKELVR